MSASSQSFDGEVLFTKPTAQDLLNEHEFDGLKYRIHKIPSHEPSGFAPFAEWIPFMNPEQIASVVFPNLNKEKEPLVRVTGTVVEWKDAP